MTGKGKKRFVRWIVTLLGASMLAGSMGCATKGGEGTESSQESAVEGQQTESSALGENVSADASDMPSDSQEEDAQASVAKEYVWDFDALVNEEWNAKAENKIKQGYQFYTYVSEVTEKVSDRVSSILDDTDISTLPKDSDLYKTIFVYRQLKDKEWRSNQARAAIKEKLDHIDSVKNLDDLYTLFREPFYELFNHGMSRDIYLCEGGSLNFLEPRAINGETALTLSQKAGIQSYLEMVGYSKKRAEEIVKNAGEIDEKIIAYQENLSKNGWFFISEKQLQQENVEYPVLDILRDLGALSDWEGFYGQLEYYDFLNDFYRPENAKKIRDYALFSASTLFVRFDDSTTATLIGDLFRGDGITQYKDGVTKSIVIVAQDILAKEYNKRYFSEEFFQNANQMLEDIKTTTRAIISESEWLTTHGKELAKRKVLRMQCNIGENGFSYDFSNVTLTDNPLDNYIAMRICYDDYWNSQLFIRGTDRKVYGDPLFEDNAYYHANLNAMCVLSGKLDGFFSEGEPAYEEMLANIGRSIAHEISHAYDPNGSSYDENGYYDPWMKDEEYEKYLERVAKIKEFFDGMEIAEGVTLKGENICAETFADLMGMECCLRILAQRENPDYDLFFRSYARVQAGYYPQLALEAAAQTSYLPSKQRINCVLAQFTQFYETYDVDPESPFYVPEESRLPVF